MLNPLTIYTQIIYINSSINLSILSIVFSLLLYTPYIYIIYYNVYNPSIKLI